VTSEGNPAIGEKRVVLGGVVEGAVEIIYAPEELQVMGVR
jgi:hypothetical protein